MKKQNTYVKAAFAKRLKKILDLRALGMTYTEVGAAVGLSAERIRQIVSESQNRLMGNGPTPETIGGAVGDAVARSIAASQLS